MTLVVLQHHQSHDHEVGEAGPGEAGPGEAGPGEGEPGEGEPERGEAGRGEAGAVAGAGSASTSTATTPSGPQISGLMSREASSPPSSQAIADTPVIAAATAPRSAGGPPRNPASSRATRSRDSISLAWAAPTGGSATARSARCSTRTPPAPTTTSGPRSGSVTIPAASSVPGGTARHTSTRGPSRAARPA